MAEINERATTSVDCPLSPTLTVSDQMQRLSETASEKIYAFVNGEIQGKHKWLKFRVDIMTKNLR